MATISPGDAEVALRTFPRRWRALLGSLDPDDPDTDALLRRPGPDGASALDCVARAAAVLEAADGHVRRTVTSERPVLSAVAAPSTTTPDLEEELARIDRAAPALAVTVGAVATGDLDRRAELAGRELRLRDLIAGAVDDVAGLLRNAERALRAARSGST